MSAPNDKKTSEPLSFAAFLQWVPPGAGRTITDLFLKAPSGLSQSNFIYREGVDTVCPFKAIR